MDFEWKKMLGSIAPVIGTAIGGPFGAIAGKMIGDIFGHEGDEAPTERELKQYLSKATPEQVVQLKQLDSEFQIKMRELGIREEELSYKDTADARDMQKQNKSNFPAILCTMLTIGFFGALWALMIYEIPETNKATIYLMIGSLGTAWVGSVQFWVGTTKGSGDKNNMLYKFMK